MANIRIIATGLRFPEAPVAMKDGSIVLTEIERQTVTRVKMDGTTEVIAHTGGGPNGAAIGPDGAVVASVVRDASSLRTPFGALQHFRRDSANPRTLSGLARATWYGATSGGITPTASWQWPAP